MSPIIGSTRPADQPATVRGGGRPQAYKDAAGKRLPSVTTVLGRFKDSGGLIRWAFEQGKAAERGEINDLYDSRDEAANIGSIVHDIAESTIARNDEELAALMAKVSALTDEQQAMVRNGVQAFASWFDGSRIVVQETETPLVSQELGFAGTFDALGRDSADRLVLLDWKTSAGVYPEYLVQLGAYAMLLEERGDVVEEAHLCRFSKEFGNFSHHQITGPMLSVGRAQFLLLLEAYKNDSLLKRRVK